MNVSPKYVGYYILGRDSIGVYAAPDEIVQTIIDELALNKQVLQMADSDIDNTRIRGKYYQITDRTVKELPENQIDMKRMTYHYVGSNQDTTSHELIMASNPPYYEMLFSNIVVFGTWDYASQHLIRLKFFSIPWQGMIWLRLVLMRGRMFRGMVSKRVFTCRNTMCWTADCTR